MKIDFDAAYDANTNVSHPSGDVMFANVGKKFVLPLTGILTQFVDSPTKEGEKGAVFQLDERHGFPPGTVITLDFEALVPEPCCDSQPCDCPTADARHLQLADPAPQIAEGSAPGAAPGTASAADL